MIPRIAANHPIKLIVSSGDTMLNSPELGVVSLRQVSFGREEET